MPQIGILIGAIILVSYVLFDNHKQKDNQSTGTLISVVK